MPIIDVSIRLDYSGFMPQFTLSISLFQDTEPNREFFSTRYSCDMMHDQSKVKFISSISFVRKICQTESSSL